MAKTKERQIMGRYLKEGQAVKFGSFWHVIERITHEGRVIDGKFHFGGTIFCTDGYAVTFFRTDVYTVK